MLDSNLTNQLREYLERVTRPIELVASLDDRAASAEMQQLLEEIAALSSQITLRLDGSDTRRPSFRISPVGQTMGVEFAAIPMGHEFTSLVLALLQVGGHPPKVDAETIDQIKALRSVDGSNASNISNASNTSNTSNTSNMVFETYISLTCHNCPDVVQALNLMAVVNPAIHAVTIDGGLFEREVSERNIMGVPSVFLNGKLFGTGRMDLGEILAKLGSNSGAAAKMEEKKPFDMLIIGGGPAGAAAAVYAARKGIRTGLVAERFGGQTLDTLGIENFISVQETTGPKFAAALEAHVRTYEVDVMTGQRVTSLQGEDRPGGLATVTLENGAKLTSRSVVLATGARWKDINVPGEAEYRTKGVAYCPHCDGPLYKGKSVAVIGGGNSGVEAAIDLAGLVGHVTLLEFTDTLKADAVLVDKLLSLPNVTVHTNAQTLEIDGDGQRVTGLRYRDRGANFEQTISLAGVFIQIGLIPNTDFLRGTLDLSNYGEIIIDPKCATSLPGVFAAGDATTVPFKQIIIATGEGSKAALSAFDHLIRSPVSSADSEPDASHQVLGAVLQEA
jgi:NADH-dependent peroxiredoxin subunit F